MQSLPSPEHLVECLVDAQLEQDVNIVMVLEEVLEPHDVLMLQRPMDLDLREQLGPGPALGQGGLGDQL